MKNLVISKNDICLIAGSGDIAYEAAISINAQKRLKNIILLNSNTKISNYFKSITIKFNIRDLNKIIEFIRLNRIKNVFIIGYVPLPRLNEIKISLKDKILLSKDIFLNNVSDQSKILKNFLNNKSIKLISQKTLLKSNLANRDDEFINKSHNNLAKQFRKNSKYIGQLFNNSISQSLIMNGNEILAIEDIFGTDYLINRLKNVYRKYNNLIFIKSKKRNQIDEIDFPVIGLNTLKLLKKYNYKIICVYHNKILINNKDEFLKYLKANSISLLVL